MNIESIFKPKIINMYQQTDALHALAKSMSKDEKRFFKLRAKCQGGRKNYMRLFDAIAEQPEYDEAQLKQKLKRYISISAFPTLKNYLFNLLVQILAQSANDEVADLQEMLSHARVLTRRGIFGQAEKLVRKVQSQARKDEDFSTEYQAWDLQAFLANFTQTGPDLAAELEAINKAKSAALQNLREIQRLDDLLFQLRHASSREIPADGHSHFGRMKSQRIRKEVDQLHPESECGKLRKMEVIYGLEKLEKAGNISLLQRICAGYAVRLESCRSGMINYLRYAFELIEIDTLAGDGKLARAAVENLRQIRAECLLERKMLAFYLNRVETLMATFDARTTQPGINSARPMADRNPTACVPEQDIIAAKIECVRFHMEKGRKKAAVNDLRDILALPKQQMSPQDRGILRLVNLMIQFDIQNQDDLLYEVVNTRRFIHRTSPDCAFEKLILKIMAMKIQRPNSSRFSIKILEELALKNMTTVNVFTYFRFKLLEWAKAQRCGIAEQKAHTLKLEAHAEKVIPFHSKKLQVRENIHLQCG